MNGSLIICEKHLFLNFVSRKTLQQLRSCEGLSEKRICAVEKWTFYQTVYGLSC